jgi:hypothetical protein
MSVGILFSSTVGHLPMLAVLIVGFVLLAARGRQLGTRSVLFARLGLGMLALSSVLGIAWTMLIPTLYSSLDYSMARYHLLITGIGLFTSLLSAGGIGLLIAALVSRGPGPAFADGPPAGGQPGGGEPYAGGPPGAGPSYGAGDQPAGPAFPG